MLQREHSAILLTFIKLPFVINIFLSIFEWRLKTGFTVYHPSKLIKAGHHYPLAKCHLNVVSHGGPMEARDCMLAGKVTTFLPGHPKSLHEFEFDRDIGDIVTACVYNVSFLGITGQVKFERSGDPMRNIKIDQIQGKSQPMYDEKAQIK